VQTLTKKGSWSIDFRNKKWKIDVRGAKDDVEEIVRAIKLAIKHDLTDNFLLLFVQGFSAEKFEGEFNDSELLFKTFSRIIELDENGHTKVVIDKYGVDILDTNSAEVC
jgi:hypothetical protein